jgi:hypothetical protein
MIAGKPFSTFSNTATNFNQDDGNDSFQKFTHPGPAADNQRLSLAG